ncbi:MAG: TRAP transporter small permease [Deltaproteobacteria bacterium]|jgi:TRAP-type C4-dicarboxylate transport system permease small subunit|nr:TRAP transporter small permease [Deltaproteobacteria bacterium]MBW2502975.1 TRAP transporter small permease [Deltaproteobacteria bacterium]MBW2519854.1 TRAP transporter small permease [Deltaproteobacteria bacterium]
MKTAIRYIHRTFVFIEDWSLFLSVSLGLLVAMANVLLRKLTADVNLYWSDEVVRKVIFFSTYVGCIAAIRNRSLIRIDALPQLIPALKKPLTLISHLSVLLFSGCMVWLGVSLTSMVYRDQFAKTASLQIPEWYFYAVLPIMGGMMFVRTLIVAVEDWFGINLSNAPLPTEEDEGA